MLIRFQPLMATTAIVRSIIFFVKLPFNDVVDLVGHMGLADQRQRLGPLERGVFAVGVERRFAPGVEHVQTLLGLAAVRTF